MIKYSPLWGAAGGLSLFPLQLSALSPPELDTLLVGSLAAQLVGMATMGVAVVGVATVGVAVVGVAGDCIGELGSGPTLIEWISGCRW